MRAFSQRLALAFALGSIVVAVVCGIGGTILDASNPADDQPWVQEIGLFLGFGGFVAAGALILVNRPANAIGWLLCYCGTAAFITFAAGEYTVYGTYTEPGSLPAVNAVGWVQSWSWFPAIALALVFLPLLFPDGKLPSLRWRPVALIAGAGIVLNTLPFMFGPELDMEVPEGTPPVDNPLGIELGGVWDVIEAVSFVVLSLVLLLALLSVITRFRKAEGDERQQLKWLMYSVGLVVLSAVAEPLLPDVSGYLFVFALVSLAGAIAIAVLKYRLYEIDLLINRTLVYVPLTAILAGLYVASTGLVRAVFTELTDAGSDSAVAISTLVVVAALTPLKNQLQALVDRYFKDQHDPLRGLRTLTTQAQGVVRVLEAERFARAFLDEAVAALDAQGGAIEFTLSSEHHAVTTEAPPVSVALTIPLYHDGMRMGELRLGPPNRGGSYDDAARRSLNEGASVLAEVIGIASRARLPDAAASSVDGASIELEPATEPR